MNNSRHLVRSHLAGLGLAASACQTQEVIANDARSSRLRTERKSGAAGSARRRARVYNSSAKSREFRMAFAICNDHCFSPYGSGDDGRPCRPRVKVHSHRICHAQIIRGPLRRCCICRHYERALAQRSAGTRYRSLGCSRRAICRRRVRTCAGVKSTDVSCCGLSLTLEFTTLLDVLFQRYVARLGLSSYSCLLQPLLLSYASHLVSYSR